MIHKQGKIRHASDVLEDVNQVRIKLVARSPMRQSVGVGDARQETNTILDSLPCSSRRAPPQVHFEIGERWEQELSPRTPFCLPPGTAAPCDHVRGDSRACPS